MATPGRKLTTSVPFSNTTCFAKVCQLPSCAGCLPALAGDARCTDSPENLPLISRRRAAKRRGAGEEHGHKHVAGGIDGEGGPTVREVPVESAAQAPEGARQRRAGHEGERRDMAQSALLALKQVMSAALAARAFASPGKAPASPDLLTSTLQHTVSGLVAAHRPDLLPPRSSSVPPLPVLDIALSRMLMDLSGGEDIAHTSQVPTHGPAAVAPFTAHAPPPLAAASTPPADFSASSSRVEARQGHQHPSPASSPPSPPDSGSSTATPQSGPAFASSHQSTGDGAGPTVPSPKHLMVPDHAAREELLMDYGGALGQPAFPDHDSLAGDGVEVPF